MKYLSICSGIEAASVAWEGLGWEAAGFSEIEPFPCAVLNYRFPHVHNFGDLTKNENWKIERGSIDVICGGTPCQSFSVAGLRAGMADPRGNLALTFLSLCDRLRPEWIIWENVPGVLSSNGGRDLGAFLGALGKLGYGTAYRILDAQYFGVAQRRRRIFVVANLTDWRRAAAVLFEPESLRGDSAKGGKARKGAPAGARNGVETIGTICADSHPGSYSGQDAYTGRLIPAVLVPPTAPTLDASYFKGPGMRGGQERAFVGVPLVPPIIGSLCARDFKGVGSQYVNEGKAIPCLAPAIPIQDGRGLDKGQNGLGIGGEGDPSYTLDTMGAASVAAPAPFVKAKRARSADDDETWQADRPAPTLSVFDSGDTRATVAIVTPEPIAIPFRDPSPTLTAKMQGASGAWAPQNEDAHLVGMLKNKTEDFQAYAVRRLTPVECERLQGFPDGWTDIPFRGKPASDGPRYKAIGNSMAVPVMRWIGERIAIVDRATKGEG